MIALGLTVVAYQVYALVATPLLEPPPAKRAARPVSDQEWQGGKLAVARYQELIAGYFPPDHWALSGTPIFVEYGQVLLALGDYHADDDGRVELTRCAVVAFPTPRSPGEPPPRDAVVVEAEGGATLQFEEKFDPLGGGVGRPVAGVFPGEITIRSDMREPGPGDDLRIVTRDLRFNQAMLRTDAEVSVRLGPHSGGGRRLEVRLVQDPLAERRGGLAVAGASSLEVREGVWAQLQLDRTTDRAPGDPPRPPMRLTSAGPFRFDFTKFVASFQQDVLAEQPNPGAASDRLACRELLLHFGAEGGRAATLSPADEPELARAQGRLLGRLEPRRLEAIGEPVRFDSPTHEAAVRGRRLSLWVGEKRLRVEGAPAKLAQGASEVQAAWIDYRSPPEETPPGAARQTLGELSVSGPGWLRFAGRGDRPGRGVTAKWNAGVAGEPVVTLRRDRAGQPVLSVGGRPEVSAEGLGRIRSNRWVAQLREVEPDGPNGPAIETGGDGRAVLVRRIDAIGDVEFQGNEVEGRADDLVAWFRPLETVGPALGNAGGGGSAGWGATDRGPSARRFVLNTKKIQLDIGYAGSRVEPTGLVCSGAVRLEQASADPRDPPLLVLGEQLRVDGLNQKGQTRLTVAGAAEGARPAGASGPDGHEGLAEVLAGGVRLWAKDLHLDQAVGRLWTEGRGDARMRLGGRSGPLGPLGGEASLRWTDGLEFNGSRITVSGEVLAEAAHDVLRCRRLTATLTRPIDLRAGRGSTEGVEVATIECSGGVALDHRSVDEQGQRSHERAWLESLSIDQATGDLRGEGPGWIRSVHLAGAGGALGPQGDSAAGLRFLRVDFRRGLDGNLNRRAVRFFQNVRSVYGPVLAWEQELPLHSPGGVPPDAVELGCDELRVHQDPASLTQRGAADDKIGPIELRALGSVRIDAAASAQGGALSAEAASASYSQAADRFTLEGDAQRLATLWVQTDPSQPPVPSSAQRLTHYRSLGRTKIDDLRGIEFRSAPPRPAGPQAASRNGGPTR